MSEFLGLSEVMDPRWIVTLADDEHRHQVSLMTRDATAPVDPSVYDEVDDVDAAYQQRIDVPGLRIIFHPLRDEEWGVRRFFFADPSGNVVNVLSHR